MAGVGVMAVYFALTTPTMLCLTTLLLLYRLYCWQRKQAAGTLTLKDKTVLITGCDFGIGHDLAKALFDHGCRVIATVYQPNEEGAQHLHDYKSDRMTVLPLDVSSDDSVAQCLRQVKEMCKDSGLWGLVNNTGVGILGEVELTTMSQYQMIADVNMFGTVRTTRAFLPLLRQAKGRIVNFSSVRGRVSSTMNAAYCMSKFAIETFSEITRMEMRHLGVKVVVVEPGNFGGATGSLNKAGRERLTRLTEDMWREASNEVREIYPKEYLDSFLGTLDRTALTSHPNVKPVIRVLTEILTSGDPDFRYLIDGDKGWLDPYCMMVRLKLFLPDRIFQQVLLYFFPYKVET
ncbi:hypothetical protein ACOMHN_058823 [Nucella lapillus]